MSILANPLFLRVLFTSGKRRRDLIIRCVYLGLLIAIVFLTLLNLGSTSLDQLAGASANLFVEMSYVQLALIALLAPIFTAAAITQEQDAQTYDVLLCTPLSNTQIVVGSLFSRIFFLLALLLSGIPVFAITQIFGGVAVGSIFDSFALAAATALFTGSFALTVATFRIGSRRPVFGFYFVLLIYLLGLWLLDSFSFFHIRLTDGTMSHTSWLTGLNPFLALRIIFNNPQAAPPNLALLPGSLISWPWSWYWTNPVSFYVTAMFLLSAVMVLPATLFLRRAAQTTFNWRTLLMQWAPMFRIGPTRKPRPVWNNPIAWRQARTKSSAARSGVFRYGLMAAGIIAALAIVGMYANVQTPGRYVLPSSWDAAHQTLMVIDAGHATPYMVDPRASISIDGQASDLDHIRGQLAVVGINAYGEHLSGIELAQPTRTISQDQARRFLLILTIVEFAAILIVVTNTAASAVTREKEDGTLDLLLATPITSRYYIWGKLRGLVAFAIPLIAIPIASLLLFVIWDAFSVGEWTIFPEAILALPPLFIVTTALAAMVGMQMSLLCRKTVAAVMSSLGIIGGGCAALAWVGWQIATTSSTAVAVTAAGAAAFSPFTLPMLLIDPYATGVRAMDTAMVSAGDIQFARLTILACAWIASAAYAAIVWTIYRNMVHNFDMTIRRQAT